ncbi:COX assembly mitochondrial protein homolog [Tubulanus polymorphus]|uniref:COX assembly mitochondrial protein homolog n=1 Tax=Tubulanus polymorphus TaxID=672921 RepID=UPI003DA201C2
MATACDTSQQEDDLTVLAGNLGGGPKGLGDPDSRLLRRVEREILIPKKMKKKAHEVHCKEIVDALTKCGKESGLFLPFLCRKENKALEQCLDKWYHNKDFVDECTQEYLAERAEYRRTGIKQKQHKKEVTGF